jgi:hypothetical protein
MFFFAVYAHKNQCNIQVTMTIVQYLQEVHIGLAMYLSAYGDGHAELKMHVRIVK